MILYLFTPVSIVWIFVDNEKFKRPIWSIILVILYIVLIREMVNDFKKDNVTTCSMTKHDFDDWFEIKGVNKGMTMIFFIQNNKIKIFVCMRFENEGVRHLFIYIGTWNIIIPSWCWLYLRQQWPHKHYLWSCFFPSFLQTDYSSNIASSFIF